VNMFTSKLESKRLGLLRELVPTAALMAFLLDPNSSIATDRLKDIQEAAHAVGQQIHILHASSERELDTAFETLGALRPGALLVGSSANFASRRDQIIALAARHAIPTIYEFREFAMAGGLMSYGTSIIDPYRQLGVYTGRVLKGEKPADLPVVQSTRFELVINLKTAKALGLVVPNSMQLLVDEFITLLGGAAVAWPLAARAQQARMPVLGFLGSAAEADYKTTITAVRRGLNEADYVEKQNLLIEYRWANFQYERLPALAAELANLPVDVILPPAAWSPRSPPNRRRRAFRSCSQTAATRSNMGWSPASTGRVATSPA
jgi:hypothetical protein